MGKIFRPLTGEAHHDADGIGVAVGRLVVVAKSEGAAIAQEDLDFSRSRAGLRYLPRRLAPLLSNFSYNRILDLALASGWESAAITGSPPSGWTTTLRPACRAPMPWVCPS
ncbi:MAG: hypothetical protein ACYCZN_02735 [Candidatus Dormibacteria bacterium]